MPPRARTDAATDACYRQLRAYRRALGAAGAGADTAALFREQCGEYEKALDAAKAAGRLTPEEAAARARAAALLRGWGEKLDPRMDADTAFDTVRAGFNRQVRKREQAVAVAGTRWKRRSISWSGLSRTGRRWSCSSTSWRWGRDSAAFLAENECERFTQYSQRLLLHEGQDALLAELERNDLRQGEGSLAFLSRPLTQNRKKRRVRAPFLRVRTRRFLFSGDGTGGAASRYQ